MTDQEIAALEPASRHAVIVRAGNMSLGVNILTKLVEKVSAALDDDFDIEIIESLKLKLRIILEHLEN